jgi:diguanylate cyclase (GGDEF)-like protein
MKEHVRRSLASISADDSAIFRWQIPAFAIVLVAMLVATEVGGFLFTSYHQRALIELRDDTREIRILQQALVDEKEHAEDYIGTADHESLDAFRAAASTIAKLSSTVVPQLEATQEGSETLAPDSRVADLHSLWQEAVALAENGKAAEAGELLERSSARSRLSAVRKAIAAYLDRKNALGETYQSRIGQGGTLVLALQILGGLLTISFLLFAFRAGSKESSRRRIAVEDAVAAREQVEILFEMADTLQSAAGYDDAHAVMAATARRLLPHLSGKLYVFSNSHDRLDMLTQWGSENAPSVEPIAASSCWALKRGKPHFNLPEEARLLCQHFAGGSGTFEVPMMARGEVYGLLSFSSDGPSAAADLRGAARLISVLADGMSLALSNLALREKLRSQALRDPLTGLYNRRYMEDMLERLVRLSARNHTSVAVVMIDLDHFKRLNDQHGHLMGDAVLRAVAGAITESLRESDVACRYGGEELIVLLPDCGLEAAREKAEDIRLRIEALSTVHGVEVTASLGIAAAPETSSTGADLIAMADAALYEAKRTGRNRAVAAARRKKGGDVTAIAAE